jgi:hypothetical protein
MRRQKFLIQTFSERERIWLCQYIEYTEEAARARLGSVKDERARIVREQVLETVICETERVNAVGV